MQSAYLFYRTDIDLSLPRLYASSAGFWTVASKQ